MRERRSNSKPLSLNRIKTHGTVCIVTNGQYTERNYFESLFNAYKPLYDVTIKYIKESSPRDLIDKAINFSTSHGIEHTYVVLDSDSAVFEDREKTGKNLNEALEYATKNNVEVIISCMAFEVWLVAHYTEIPIHDSLGQIKSSLTKYIASRGGKTKYEKNNKDIIDKYFIGSYEHAMTSAETSYQNLKKNFENGNQHGYLWDFGNYTMVWYLIESFQLKSKYKP